MCTNENVQRVNNLIATDRRITVRHVAQCLKLSHGTTHQETFVSYQGETTRKVESRSAASPLDNAPAHTSAVAMSTIRESKFELLSHPPYSPDLALSDYRVCRSLKNLLRGQRFDCDEEVVHAINDWFKVQDKKFFVDDVNSLVHQWEKCVAIEGDYIEILESEFDDNRVLLCFSHYIVINPGTQTFTFDLYLPGLGLNLRYLAWPWPRLR